MLRDEPPADGSVLYGARRAQAMLVPYKYTVVTTGADLRK